MKRILLFATCICLTTFPDTQYSQDDIEAASANANKMWAEYEYRAAMRNLLACYQNYKDVSELELLALKKTDILDAEIKEAVMDQIKQNFSNHKPDCADLAGALEKAKEKLDKATEKAQQIQ